jgi:hypothetical protein
MFSYTMFTLQNQFQTTFALVEMTVISTEENSNDFCGFCPDYVQEFGRRMGGTAVGECNNRKCYKNNIAIIPSVPNILYRTANEWPPRVFYYLRLFFFA